LAESLLACCAHFLHHGALNVVHRVVGGVEGVASGLGELGGQCPAVRGCVGSGHKAPCMQAAEHVVHGLPGDERAAGQLGIGLAGALTEEFQAGVLGRAQSERGQSGVHRCPERDRGAFQHVPDGEFEIAR